MMWNPDDSKSFPGEVLLYAALFFGDLRRRALKWKARPDASCLEHYRQFFREHLWSLGALDADREAFVATLDKVYHWVKKNPDTISAELAHPVQRVAKWVQGNHDLVKIMNGMRTFLPPSVLSWILIVQCTCYEIYGVCEEGMAKLPEADPPDEVKARIAAFSKAYSDVKLALCIP